MGDPAAIDDLERIAAEDALVFKRAAKNSLIQIEAKALDDTDKVKYIKNQIEQNQRNIALVTWGVHTLGIINTPEALDALTNLAESHSDSPGFLNLLSSQALSER